MQYATVVRPASHSRLCLPPSSSAGAVTSKKGRLAVVRFALRGRRRRLREAPFFLSLEEVGGRNALGVGARRPLAGGGGGGSDGVLPPARRRGAAAPLPGFRYSAAAPLDQARPNGLVLEGALVAHKSRLFPILGRDRNLPAAGIAIEWRKDGRLAYAIDELVNAGQRVRIHLHHDIQKSVIDAEAEGAILLCDEHDRKAPFRRRRFDDVRLQLPLDLGRLGFPRREARAERREADWPGAVVGVDAVLSRLDDAQRLARPRVLVLAQHAADPVVQRRVGIREVHVLYLRRGRGWRCGGHGAPFPRVPGSRRCNGPPVRRRSRTRDSLRRAFAPGARHCPHHALGVNGRCDSWGGRRPVGGPFGHLRDPRREQFDVADVGPPLEDDLARAEIGHHDREG